MIATVLALAFSFSFFLIISLIDMLAMKLHITHLKHLARRLIQTKMEESDEFVTSQFLHISQEPLH